MKKYKIPISKLRHKLWKDARWGTGEGVIEEWPELPFVRAYLGGDFAVSCRWIAWRIEQYQKYPDIGEAARRLVQKYGLRRGIAKLVAGKLRTLDSIRRTGYDAKRGEITGRVDDKNIVIINGHHPVMALYALGETHVPRITICE